MVQNLLPQFADLQAFTKTYIRQGPTRPPLRHCNTLPTARYPLVHTWLVSAYTPPSPARCSSARSAYAFPARASRVESPPPSLVNRSGNSANVMVGCGACAACTRDPLWACAERSRLHRYCSPALGGRERCQHISLFEAETYARRCWLNQSVIWWLLIGRLVWQDLSFVDELLASITDDESSGRVHLVLGF